MEFKLFCSHSLKASVNCECWTWHCKLVHRVLRRSRQEDQEFEANLDYAEIFKIA